MAGSSHKMLELSGMPVLEQISGGEKGRLYELSRGRVSIGRGSENDIVVASDGVSRNHALIEITREGQYLIRDNGSKNGIQVNGSAVRSAILQTGDVIRVGTLVFRFNEGGEGMALEAPPVEGAESDYLPEAAPPAAKPAGVNKRVLIYGAALLILGYVFLFNDSNESEKKAGGDGETSKKEERLKITEAPELVGEREKGKVSGLEDPTLKTAEQDIEKLDWANTPLKEAELYFRRGLRDYGNQSYSRAMENFEAALSLNRTHPLAQIYLARTKSEAEQAAKKEMEVAVKYFDSLQYQRSIYHFQAVIHLLSHRPGEKIVKDCEKYIEVARRRLQASEIFP